MRARRHTAPGNELLPRRRARRPSAAVQLQPFSAAALTPAQYNGRPRRLSHWEGRTEDVDFLSGPVVATANGSGTDAADVKQCDDDADLEPLLPTWWIVFQFSWWSVQWVTGGLLGGILVGGFLQKRC